MHYRFSIALVCFVSLQSNAMIKERRTTTMSPIEIASLSALSFLPTSAPRTPQDALDKFLKTTKSSCDFTSLVRKKEKCLAALEYIEKYLNAKMFIEKLQEEKRAEKQRLEEKKEWLKYVGEINNSGYFPHSEIAYETHYSSNNRYDQGDWYP